MTVSIHYPVPEAIVPAAARFGAIRKRSLDRVLGPPDRRAALLAPGFAADRAIVAVDGGEIVGLLTFHAEGHGAYRVAPGLLRKSFGGIAGPVRGALLKAVLSRGEPGGLYVEGIDVIPERRGQGVGHALLRQAEDVARASGLGTVSAEARARSEAAIWLFRSISGTSPQRVRSPATWLLGFGTLLRFEWSPGDGTGDREDVGC